ncbi:MAG TPA: hypothetical protein VKG38_19880 [Solirubrobacteraceae bacterium]|nr:hypothetical protein [Solirubrobacteraceae bacterium]
MISSEVQRTLVKSPPELWAELSDPDALARHLGELGDIRITRVEPESVVEWQAEGASGSVHIKASGWGTRVTLRATRETPAPQPAASREPTGEEAGPADAAASYDTGPATEAPVTPTPDTAAPDAATIRAAALDPTGTPDSAAPDPPVPEAAAPSCTSDAEPEPSPADAAHLLVATGEQPELPPTPAQVDASEWPAAQDPGDEPAPRLSLLARLLAWRRRNRVPAQIAEDTDYAAPDERAQGTASDEPPTAVPIDPQPVAEARSEQAYPHVEPDAQVPQADPEPGLGAATTEADPEPGPEHATMEADPEPEPEAEGPEAAREPRPETEPTAAARAIEIAEELRIAEETAAEQVQAVLTSVLDRLGAAHHRPFSRA